MMNQIFCGDAIEILKTIPDETFHCCITSPPYYGLRDYGTAKWKGGDPDCNHQKGDGTPKSRNKSTIGFAQSTGHNLESWGDYCRKCGAVRIDKQIGLEETPEEYVARLVEIFREVKRVLRKDGTFWLNLGDSYTASNGGSGGHNQKQDSNKGSWTPANARRGFTCAGLKPKDLIGIPSRVALALQEPYYAGKIKSEADRIWLAAMIDGEGCMFIHKRKVGQNNGQGYERKHDSYGAGLEVSQHSSVYHRKVHGYYWHWKHLHGRARDKAQAEKYTSSQMELAF